LCPEAFFFIFKTSFVTGSCFLFCKNLPALVAQTQIPFFQPLAYFFLFPVFSTFISVQMAFYRNKRQINTNPA